MPTLAEPVIFGLKGNSVQSSRLDLVALANAISSGTGQISPPATERVYVRTEQLAEGQTPHYGDWLAANLRTLVSKHVQVITDSETKSWVVSEPSPRGSARRGQKITLREAWDQAGRVFEEAQWRRKQQREEEARQFLSTFTEDGV